jgi:hypothetical protein
MKLKQWWKSKSYWLKGGIIGLIVAVVLFIIYLFCGLNCTELDCVICAIFMLPGVLSVFYSNRSFLLVIIINIIIFFLIGALMGKFIEKIKSKK